MKEKIYKIPIIGYLLKVIISLIKLPDHLKKLYESNQTLAEEVEKLGIQLYKTEKKLKEQQIECGNLVSHIEQFERDITRDTEKQLEQYNQIVQRCTVLEHQIVDFKDRIQDQQERLDNYCNLRVDAEYIKKLNWLCSSQPTLWGKTDRLHVSKLASVNSCFFNTNSGSITIGDYTFAGSGVSILAGSHDKDLTGFLRRDAEVKGGCDIIIGQGVWLASNCTILGPANIGDNAIIAAGAVLVPNTIVPSGTIYGGIPAKEIGRINQNSGSVGSLAWKQAMRYSNGILFTDGWREKSVETCNGVEYLGHVNGKKEVELYSELSNIKLFFKPEDNQSTEIEIKGACVPNGNISIMSAGTNVDITFNEVKNDSIYKMCIEFNKETEMFVAVIKTSDK